MHPQDPKGLTTTLFYQALSCPKDQRAGFLSDACAGNEQLFRKVKELLDAYTGLQSLPRLPADSGFSPVDLEPESFIALLERYEDIEIIGRGGMGLVFRARDREIDKVVALKVLLPSLAKNEPPV